MMKQVFRARYLLMLLWIIVPAAAYLSYLIIGLPHAIRAYEYTAHNGRQYDPYADRTYYTCTFAGPYGFLKRPATNGQCEWFRFFKKADGERNQ